MRRNVRFLASNLAELRGHLRDRDQRIEHLIALVERGAEELSRAADELEQLQHYVRELERQLEQEEQTHER